MRVETLNIQRKKEEWEHIRRLATSLAHGMLMSGAETYRIEETASRVLLAYGAVEVDVFAIANFLSIAFETPDGIEYFAQKRVKYREDNLARVALLNDYTRRVCALCPDPEEALDEVREIMTLENHKGYFKKILITGYVGFGFALMLGTSFLGALMAFVLDALMRSLTYPLSKLSVNRLLINVFGSFVVTMLAMTTGVLGLGQERSLIVAASLMVLFPGISLMNAIRDIISNDLVAGLSKLLETLLAALSIAIGSGLALSIERLFL